MAGQRPSVSFPAGARAEGKGIHSASLVMDPLPSLTLAGDDTHGIASEHVNACR
jgi:hypothetical protein